MDKITSYLVELLEARDKIKDFEEKSVCWQKVPDNLDDLPKGKEMLIAYRQDLYDRHYFSAFSPITLASFIKTPTHYLLIPDLPKPVKKKRIKVHPQKLKSLMYFLCINEIYLKNEGVSDQKLLKQNLKQTSKNYDLKFKVVGKIIGYYDKKRRWPVNV